MSELKQAMREQAPIIKAKKGQVKTRPQGYNPNDRGPNPGKGFRYDEKNEVWTRK